MASPRAFIAFQVEDRWARDFLVEQAHKSNNTIDFRDYSVHDPFDEKWKTNCRERIALTRGTIVLVGRNTWRSEAVLWEIAESNRQNHYLFGIQINRDETHAIPTGLSAKSVIRWDFAQITKWLNTWT
jgi:hypothetical protein